MKQCAYFANKLMEYNYSGTIDCYCKGEGLDLFREKMYNKGFNTEVFNYVEPREMPDLLHSYKYLLVSSPPKSIPETSNMLLEGVAAGCIVISMYNEDEIYQKYDFSLLYEDFKINQRNIYRSC